jgi:hypothetical protein
MPGAGMTHPASVLLDASAWIAFFSPIGHDVLKAEVRKALNEERVFTCTVRESL